VIDPQFLWRGCLCLCVCICRSWTDLGSSSAYPETMRLDYDMLDNDPNNNPLLHNWNMVRQRIHNKHNTSRQTFGGGGSLY
jgi:hypothetical protein